MCGITGAVQLGGPPRAVLLPGTIRRMTEVVRHRGPDDFGTHVEPGVEFGARRLSIIDVAGGHQPLANEDGRVIAMQNGELYNHRAIRDSLVARGHQFRTACDTEVLPHLYEDDADSFETSLRGMFAVAVWDPPDATWMASLPAPFGVAVTV